MISDLKLRLLDVTHSNTSTLRVVLSPSSGDPIGINGSGFVVRSSTPPTASSPNWTFADTGDSTTQQIQNSFTLEAGESATIVISMLSTDAECPAYTVWLEQNACLIATLKPLFADGFEDP